VTEPDEYFEHGADIGVIGRGASLEEAFVQAAVAMFAIMVEPASLKETLTIEVEFDEDDIELALVRWLNALLALAREHRAVFGRFELLREGTHWHGRAYGEPWREAHPRGTEVKGATLTALSVRQDADGWQARCVVDV
jgi:SHS2 domain-containing protein